MLRILINNSKFFGINLQRSNRYFVFIFFALLFPGSLFAQNPVISDIGMSDPHIRVFNDTIFLFCGHDSGPDDRTWVMRNWRVFSSTDMVNWEQETVISPSDNYMDDNSTDCWAGDAAQRNGKNYFYFSDRKRGVGVMQADNPGDPYRDALGKPLVSPMHDPTVLVDDDENKTPYLVYGDKEGGGFHIARLNNDMISVAESPKPITINGDEWQKAPKWMDKNYIFKYKDTYYLSWGRDYAISKNVYGPYECVGAVGQGYKLSEFAHGSFFWWKGQFYHIWCYYIRDGYKYRESIITYCHFDKNDHIITDTKFLDNHFEYGMGRYDASWNAIQAEWYYEKTPGIEKKQNNKGDFVLGNFEEDSWIRFANVNFNNDSVFNACYSSTNSNAAIEIRTDSINGKLYGTLQLKEGSEQCDSVDIKMPKGEKDLYLIFKGSGLESLELDWINFAQNKEAKK